MASVKNLKKDIEFLSNELVATAIFNLHLNDSADQKEAEALVSQTIINNEAFKIKVNRIKKSKDAKEIKGAYKAVAAEFLQTINDGFEKINKLNKL